MKKIIEQMQKMCVVLIDFANTIYEFKARQMKESEPILRLKNLDHVHCMTVKLPVSMSANYDENNLTTIVRWDRAFSCPGGINQPKRIQCLCSDGKSYSQLLKGQDDLHQDAVMQQVFTMMNDMLSKSTATRKENLLVRTYIIVPLSKRSGILEWCSNTTPLGDYLAGQDNVHQRYHPEDETPLMCRRKLRDAFDQKLSSEKKYELYKQLCSKLKPALQYFFFENFLSPGVFYERRLAFAHSLATNSMIGYILGIGDRHVGNILLDKHSGELIFIDFGIAFEQGKMMPTPELVPFRLTRDFVAALGATGVEGVFRESCEKTLQVLRENKATIRTILDILLHDPLYAWTMSSNEAVKRQIDDTNAIGDLPGISDVEGAI